MMIPIRCFTCGGLIADKWEEYKRRVVSGEPSGKVLDDLGVKRYCCRRMIISHLDLVDEFLKYTEVVAEKRGGVSDA